MQNKFSPSVSLHSSLSHPILRHYNLSNQGLVKKSLIYPIFISDQLGLEEIKSLPGQFRIGIDVLTSFLTPFIEKGLSAVLLFGIPKNAIKNNHGSAADDPNGPVVSAIKLLSVTFPHLLILTDVCLVKEVLSV